MLNRALPWKRGTSAAADAGAAGSPPDAAPSRRRRGGRAGRRGASDGETAATRARRSRRERRRQLIAVIVGAVLILTILAVVAVGVWQQYILPPRVMAGQVRDVRFTMGDLVERIRVLQGINRYEGGAGGLQPRPLPAADRFAARRNTAAGRAGPGHQRHRG